MSSVDIYQKHLDRVSRSFAFCIATLEGPLRRWVSLTYLICRILDTVEDAPWKRSSLQMQHFTEFDEMLESPESLKLLAEWKSGFPEEIDSGERKLLLDSEVIFNDLHHFPERVRNVIQDLVGAMSRGMQYFAQRKEEGSLRLRGIEEVNQYCFFVAGVVGESLAQLLACSDSSLKLHRQNIINAHHFGLFLQKVNLLKDRRGDEIEGRFFVHSYDEVYESLGRNARGGFEYLMSVPVEQRSYRLFCAWSLYLGLASLPWINKANQQDKDIKIPRTEAMALVAKVKLNINQPENLRAMYEKYYQAAGLVEVTAKEVKVKELPWFFKLYRGTLSPNEMAELGLIA